MNELDIRFETRMILSQIFKDNQDLNNVFDLIIEDVLEDVSVCADKDHATPTDVSIAVQRTLLKNLGFDI